MSIHTEVIDASKALQSLRTEWDSLVHDDPLMMDGLDATNGSLWYQALCAAFPQARTAKVVVARRDGEVVGMLPLIAERNVVGCKRLRTLTALYGGRCGFLVRGEDPMVLAALLDSVRDVFGPWTNLKMDIVDGGASDRMLRAVAPRLSLELVHHPSWSTPWFPMSDDAETFLAALPKDLRWRVRSGRRKLQAQGRVDFVEINSEGMAGRAIHSILDVDRQSWKHKAGTAITCHPYQEAFYRALFPSALGEGLLYGQILEVDGRAAAFHFGLLRNGVFTSLKHSQSLEYQANSPSHVLKTNLVEALRAKGALCYDSMGLSEPHKLRWSPHTKTYSRHTVLVFSAGPCGRLGHRIWRAKGRLLPLIRRSPAPAATEVQEDVP